jgi:hypothetical protein
MTRTFSRKHSTLQPRYLILLAIVLMPAIIGTGCSIIAPAPTPLPIFPTATARLSVSPTAAPPPTSAPIPTAPPPPSSAAPQPTTNSQPQAQRITFPPGGTAVTLQGTLAPNGLDRYVLRALAGQTLMLNFAPSDANVTIQVSGADGSVLLSGGARVITWSAALPATQDYFIGVISNATAPATYTLQVTIPPFGATPATDDPRRITFPPGGTTATIQGVTATPGLDRFLIRALAGQTMSVSITATQGPAILIIYAADGNVLISDHAGASSWSGTLPATQDYFIDTRSIGDAKVNFALTVTIPPK